MPVTVQWGKDRFHFELPPLNTTLEAVRRSIAEYTHLPFSAFHIVHDGAVMSDNSAPISQYNLRPNSTIAIVPEQHFPSSPFKNTEPAQIADIRAELNHVRADLLPAHVQFIRDLQSSTPNAPIPPRKALEKERSRIAELLLQALLRLDAIIPEPNWHDARTERKAAVKELQAMLDSLDAEWAAASASLAAVSPSIPTPA